MLWEAMTRAVMNRYPPAPQHTPTHDGYRHVTVSAKGG